MAAASDEQFTAVIKLKPIEATPETFKEFGQVIEASNDGEEFGPNDAQLDLSHGIPRSYSTHSFFMTEYKNIDVIQITVKWALCDWILLCVFFKF